MNGTDSNIGEIVMYQPDETIRLEVRVEDETVWLTQAQIASLFLRERSVISRHINNVFKEGECDKDSNVHFLHIANSDKPVMYYSLDVIISVGYRVKSLNGTIFRRWANGVLKQYLLKGYAVNQRMFDIEQKVVEQGLEIKELRQKIDFFVRSSLPPIEGIFYDGQIFDAYAQIIGCEHLPAQPRPLRHHRRRGLHLRCQPEGRRQEALRLHPYAGDIGHGAVERNQMKN